MVSNSLLSPEISVVVELNQKEENSKAKNLANEYLNKILDYAEQFRY